MDSGPEQQLGLTVTRFDFSLGELGYHKKKMEILKVAITRDNYFAFGRWSSHSESLFRSLFTSIADQLRLDREGSEEVRHHFYEWMPVHRTIGGIFFYWVVITCVLRAHDKIWKNKSITCETPILMQDQIISIRRILTCTLRAQVNNFLCYFRSCRNIDDFGYLAEV